MESRENLISHLMVAEKGLMERVANLVLSDPERLQDLFSICISNEKVVSWRAAWVLNHITRKDKALIKPILPAMVRHFPSLKYDGQKACFLRSMSYFDLHDENIGLVLDECLDFLRKESSRPFMISYALDFLQRICEHEPDLANEVCLTISAGIDHFPTTYLQKKARRIQKNLESMHQQSS